MDINDYQVRDLGKIFSLSKTIAQRKKKQQAIEQLELKLQKLKQKSKNKTEQIASQLPSISVEENLPIFEKTSQLIELIKDNQVVIVAGETGCGKTTQLPKICLQAGLGTRGLIAHTQPRRVAATSVAARIASEIKTPLGDFVGYSVRFSDKYNHNTRIKLMTDGILLSELQSDPMLSRYQVIIIDEAHERSLNIDFLLGFLKQLLKKRKELKVIVTSATIDPLSFSKYFNQAPIITVEGRTFPVEVKYQPIEESVESDSTELEMMNIKSAVESCLNMPSGDILIFSHGEHEIKTISKFLKQQDYPNVLILPLYARLSINEQQAIFRSSSKRKIVIATNVAETSLTIPNILFVIDLGTARISRYSQRNKIQQLPVEKISQASAEQRKGRCGRIAPGICIRLYSEDDYDSRQEFTQAEIKRTNLSSVVLRLKSMGVDEIESFSFIESPDERQWKVAFNLLFELAAMNEQREITAIGKQMSLLPLDPQLARILLDPTLQAVDEMLIIASFLSVRDVRLRPHDRQQKADQLHAKYNEKSSDIISIINLWRHLQEERKNSSSNQFRRWCQKNMINFVGWLEWRNVYQQIKENVGKLGVSINQQKAEAEEVHRSLICGFVSHILMKTQERSYQGARGLKVWIHPSSVFFKQNSQWLLSTEMIETDKVYARSNVPIKVEWLEEIAPHLTKSHYQDIHWRKKNGHAACFLNLTLLGLPIVNRRLTDYSQIDPVESRELFLLEGLAKDSLNYNFPFLNRNRGVINSIRLEEEKLRKSDLLINEHDLAEKYDNIIPSQIVNSLRLKKWLKRQWQERNKILSFDKESLSQNNSDSIDEYPSDIYVRGVSLPLSYCFSPGEPEDGITVDIPKEMLHQFKQSDFDWLVPGYLNDKILAVLKILPKKYRKPLIPLAQTANECTAKILKEKKYFEQPFKVLMAKTINHLKATRLTENDFDLDALPVHLRMKFKNPSSGKDNQSISYKLIELKADTRTSEEKNANHVIGKQEFLKLYSWPKFDVELEVSKTIHGNQVRLFHGLIDKNTHVEFADFSDLKSAHFNHRKGVARLILLSQLRLIKDIKNGWPERREIEKYQIRFGGFDSLLDWISLSVAISILDKENQVISTEKQFLMLCKIFASQARQLIAEGLTKQLKLLKHMAKIYDQLSKLNSDVYCESVEDIKQQIISLWTGDKFIQLGYQLSSTYSRYFLAIESRITRIQENFPKEQQALDNWLEWQQWFFEFEQVECDTETQQLIDELFWMLEEYRISLFATQIKAQGSISAKKLQTKFELIESNLTNLDG